MKKILVLMISLLFSTGMALIAFAGKINDNLSVGTALKIYLGQYDSGKKGEKAYVSDYSEMNLWMRGSKGVMSARAEIEYRNNLKRAFAIQYYVNWAATKRLDIKLGTITNAGWGLPFSRVGHLTAAVPADLVPPVGFRGYTEDPGIGIHFKATPTMNVGANYYTNNYLNNHTFSDTMDRSKGNGYQVGSNGKLGLLGYKVYFGADTTDDVNDKDDKAIRDSVYGVGVQWAKKTWNISTDYKSRTDQKLSGTKVKTLDANTLLMFAAGMDAGPGNARVAYQIYNVPDDKTTKNVKDGLTKKGLQLRYNYGVSGGIIQFIYNNEATDNKLKTAKDTTATFAGFGFRYDI